jgi:hypothetical protein
VTYIWEVPSLIVAWNSEYLDWGISCSASVPPSKCWKVKCIQKVAVHLGYVTLIWSSSSSFLVLGPIGWRHRMYCSHVWLIVLARLWKYPLAPPGAPTPTTTREIPSRERGNYGPEMAGNFVDKWRVPRHLKVSLHAANLRHGNDGFTSPPKESMLRIFSP